MSSEEGDMNHHKMQRLNESRPGSTSPDICSRPSGTGGYPLYHPASLYHYRPPVDMKHTPGGSTNPSLNSKPRIWSLADMASKEEKQPSDAKQTPPTATLPGLYPSVAGKIISPLPSRMHYAPFFKPDMGKDIYRNFNSTISPHLPVRPDYAFLESYQRALESVHPLSSVISKSMENNNQSYAPLSLTTNNNNNNNNNNHTAGLTAAGVSPSASSTSSSRPDNTTPVSTLPSSIEANVAIH